MMTGTMTSIAVMTALGLLAPIHANAFGLGKIELSSALNEPFKAEIAITALKGDEAANLQVRLASAKEFEQAGIERHFLLTQFKIDVVEKAGSMKIVISSQQSVREPFLDFLLTATTTSSGRLIREYTVLLDPPINVFKKPVKSAVHIPVAATSTRYQYPASSVSTTTSDISSTVDSYGPTMRNDTLWEVALKTRPERKISVHQMMIALLNTNPSAFQHNNINGLKAGYTLSVPSANEIRQLNKQQAINAVQEQNTLWKNRNVRPAVQVNDVIDEVASSAAESTAVTDDAPMVKPLNTDTNSDGSARLKLVVPTDKAVLNDDALSPLGGEKIKALSEQLTLAQETIEGQTQENIDFKVRMDAMEAQMDTMRRLISLKDADLARLQGMLGQEQPSEENLPVDATVEESLPVDDSIDESAITPMLNESLDAPMPSDESGELSISTDESEMSSVEKWEAIIGTGSNETDTMAVTEVITEDVTPPVIESTEIIDEMAVETPISPEDNATKVDMEPEPFYVTAEKFVVDNRTEIAMGAGGLLLLLVGLLIMKRRKEPDYSWDDSHTLDTNLEEDEPNTTQPVNHDKNDNEEKIVNATEIEPSDKVAVTEDKTVAELIDQADMLIAYTDYDQAMTLLEQAKRQEPTNLSVLTKVLFVMFKQQKTDDFVSLAGELTIDKTSSEWSEVAVWGRELAPLNELFKSETVESVSPSDLTLDAFTSVTEDEATLDFSSTQEADVAENNESNTIEFNLDDFSQDDLVIADSATTSLAENDADSLTLITDVTPENEQENIDFDTPLNFEIEPENSALSLNDEPLSLDIDEPLSLDINSDVNEVSLDLEPLELPDEPVLSSDADALAVDLQNLDASLDLEPNHDNDNDGLGFDISGFDEIDETETKLDLASAYADMNDVDGARSILEEVLKEGNDDQKSKAQALLADLS